jgi:hypothetical protein
MSARAPNKSFADVKNCIFLQGTQSSLCGTARRDQIKRVSIYTAAAAAILLPNQITVGPPQFFALVSAKVKQLGFCHPAYDECGAFCGSPFRRIF